MSHSLSGKKIALLIANGFDQADMTAAQRALIEKGANVRIVSPETGLVNGWDNISWGHNFAVDQALNTALGADFDMVVVPGGERSANKLKLTAHSKRFLGSFINAGKPVCIMGDALALMVFTDLLTGRTVDGPDALAPAATQVNAVWEGKGEICFDANLMTGSVTDATRSVFVETMLSHFMGGMVEADLVTSKAA